MKQATAESHSSRLVIQLSVRQYTTCRCVKFKTQTRAVMQDPVAAGLRVYPVAVLRWCHKEDMKQKLGVSCEIWGYRSGVAGGRSSEMLRRIDWATVTDVSKERSAIFFLDYLTLKIKALSSFETSVDITRHGIRIQKSWFFGFSYTVYFTRPYAFPSVFPTRTLVCICPLHHTHYMSSASHYLIAGIIFGEEYTWG